MTATSKAPFRKKSGLKKLKIAGSAPVMRPKKARKPANKADYRFVLSKDGAFVHVSPDFAHLTGIDADTALDAKPSEILHFVDADEVAGDRILFNNLSSGETPGFVSSIRAGTHTLICGPEQTRIDFQFDWVNGPDGGKYLVASAPAMAIPQRDQDLRKLMLQIGQQAPHQSPAIPANSVPDSDMASVANVFSSSSIGTSVSSMLKAEELRLFLDMTDDIMCTLHDDGALIRFNPAFLKTIGQTTAGAIGKVFVDFVHQDDRAQVRNVFYGMSGTDEDPGTLDRAIDLECRLVALNGDVHWVHWKMRRQRGILYALGRDITDTRNQDAALKRREQELSEAHALARMGHWRWEMGNTNIVWSREIYTMFGVEQSVFQPSMEALNALVHRRDLGRVLQAFQRAIIQRHDYDMDFRVIQPSGEIRHIRCEGRCEIDVDGEVIALYGIMQDITAQSEHEEALREAKEAAENAYAAKSRFLANMSHELRTPLNAIIGFSDMMDKQVLGPLGNDRYNDYILGIRESGQHLLDLITDILDMSKIEAGKYELNLERLDLAKSIRLAAHMMEGRAHDGQIKLTCNTPDEAMEVIADRRGLKQIMLNLLSNAIKFTEAGGSVDVKARKDGENVFITVRDTGIGIPAHKIRDVTKPFEQVSNAFTRRHEGSGLGLAITKDLVELHKGELNIESRMGVGTTVTVRLPVTPPVE